jgi:hypothetical protein
VDEGYQVIFRFWVALGLLFRDAFELQERHLHSGI